MFATPLQGVVGEGGPGAGRKVPGVVGVDVDVVNFVRHKTGQPLGGDLLIAGREGGDEFHVSVEGVGRGLIAQRSTAQMSSPRAPPLNMVVTLMWASRTTPPM